MHKILIVDDEPAARYGIRRALEGPEIQVFEAGNAEAARRLIRLHRPDIMLADINMPNEDGIALLHSLEQDPPSPLTIMVTAYGAAKVAVEAMKAGAYDYIIKTIRDRRAQAGGPAGAGVDCTGGGEPGAEKASAERRALRRHDRQESCHAAGF